MYENRNGVINSTNIIFNDNMNDYPHFEDYYEKIIKIIKTCLNKDVFQFIDDKIWKNIFNNINENDNKKYSSLNDICEDISSLNYKIMYIFNKNNLFNNINKLEKSTSKFYDKLSEIDENCEPNKINVSYNIIPSFFYNLLFKEDYEDFLNNYVKKFIIDILSFFKLTENLILTKKIKDDENSFRFFMLEIIKKIYNDLDTNIYNNKNLLNYTILEYLFGENYFQNKGIYHSILDNKTCKNKIGLSILSMNNIECLIECISNINNSGIFLSFNNGLNIELELNQMLIFKKSFGILLSLFALYNEVMFLMENLKSIFII